LHASIQSHTIRIPNRIALEEAAEAGVVDGLGVSGEEAGKGNDGE
jgi:hypothetical protein